MKVNMESLLKEQKQKDQAILNSDPIKDVKLLLEGDSQEDLRILRNLSNSSQLSQVETIRGRQIELENLEKNYVGDVYTIDQIKKLCIDYHLRFLSSNLYTGSFDVELTAKLKQFSADAKVELNEWNLKNKFFIMAPQEMFQLRDEKYLTKRQLDPVIFYKINDTHYRMVHKWGNDFTIFRLIDGFRWKSWWNYQLFNTFMLMPIFGLIIGLFSDIHDITHRTILIPTLITSLSFISAYFIFAFEKHDEGEEIHGFFSNNNWCSESKLKR